MSIQDLLSLQRLDIRITALAEFMDDLPRRREAITAERERARAEIESKRLEFDNIKKEVRRQERLLQDGEERLRQVQAKLNQVKTNKEYEASLREIEEQRRANGRIEEEIIRLFDEVEEADKAIGEIEKEAKRTAAEFDELEEELRQLSALVEAELAEKKAQREAMLPGIPPEFLRVYNRLSSFMKRPMARADKEVCQGCHVHIPAQRYNMVLKGKELIICPSCQRILVHCESEIDEGLTEVGR